MNVFENRKSKIENDFLPLDAPRLSPPSPPAEAISWLESVAPQLPAAPSRMATPIHGNDASGKGVHRAEFLNIDDIVIMERGRDHTVDAELPEITRRRQDAEDEACSILTDAVRNGQTLERESEERGYQAGYQRGHAEGRREGELSALQQASDDRTAYQEDLALFIDHIEAQRRSAWAEMEPTIIKLIFDLACKVIKKEVEASRDVALAVIRNALRRVSDGTTLRIRVHADDLPTVRANRDQLLSLVDGNRHIEIVEDRRVSAGGCIVETDAGNIDASIETQTHEIAKALEVEWAPAAQPVAAPLAISSGDIDEAESTAAGRTIAEAA